VMDAPDAFRSCGFGGARMPAERLCVCSRQRAAKSMGARYTPLRDEAGRLAHGEGPPGMESKLPISSGKEELE
jgi:hypothetical protein